MKSLGYSLLLGLASLASFTTAAAPTAAPPTAYSGRAFAAFVNTGLTGPLYFSDTGELPSRGGVRGNSLLNASVPGVLGADVLVASTSGASGVAHSSASLANVSVLPGSGTELSASFLRAETRATCEGLFGSSEVVGLRFMGQNVTVTGQPNQTITVPGVATLIINEQTRVDQGNYHEIRVNAIHLVVNGVAEVILSSAKSDIRCATTGEGPCHDFVTGGGWIDTSMGQGHFGFNAGRMDRNGNCVVHFNWVDRGANVHMRAESCTLYGGTGNKRNFRGTCSINGQSGFTYNIWVWDNGEPGRNVDHIAVWFSNGYMESGDLRGGNIQLHDPCNGRP